MTNSDMLIRQINNAGLKRVYIARKLGISTYSLQKKINNVTEFRASEIKTLAETLNICDPVKFSNIFFA